jgi:hypothetical protein
MQTNGQIVIAEEISNALHGKAGTKIVVASEGTAGVPVMYFTLINRYRRDDSCVTGSTGMTPDEAEVPAQGEHQNNDYRQQASSMS